MVMSNRNNGIMRVLVVDDDEIFRSRLGRAFVSRGLEAHVASGGVEGLELARRVKPKRAVVDLRMPGMNGLELVSHLHQLCPAMKILVLTGYGSIPSAVDAVHRGAIEYLTKPVDTEQILDAFARHENGATACVAGGSVKGADWADDSPAVVPSLARVEYEHIQRILSDCDGNISAAARRLKIHRRSLQRKLGKLPPLA